ncbi:MAG TPA: NAD(P)-binding domain-containing protein [Streptosporangiaceae bacterium]|jgi:thioredoxin reductase
MTRVCVIGAGSSGLASCQVLHARGLPFDCFETGSQVGGNWRYGNDNGMSSAYRSLHANSSRRGMQYASFPMPDSYPSYLSHTLLARYFDDFVDSFGFRGQIRFRTEVTAVRPAPAGGWDVTARQRDTGAEHSQHYRAVLVANGHHWQPRYPEPAVPGAARFTGEQLHSHGYRAPEPFTGRRVLVVGIGNSACDIATDCSQVAAATLLAVRRGAHILPKHLFGRPTDHLTFWRLGALAPPSLQRAAVALLVRAAQGKVTKYGLPKPDHRLLSAPPTLSDSLLSKLDHGDITVKPAIARFERDRVRFTDGSAEQVDVVIYCTGYRVSFPFLSEALIGADGEIPLYRRVVPPRLPGLYFIGLVQPIGATMPVAEVQSEWVADLLEGRAALPPGPRMDREIARYRAATSKRYTRSTRPLIQVDFQSYLREIRRERRKSTMRHGTAPGRRAHAGVAAGRADSSPMTA